MDISELGLWYRQTEEADQFMDPSTQQPLNFRQAPSLLSSEPDLKRGLDFMQKHRPHVEIWYAEHTEAEDLGSLAEGAFERAIGRVGLYGFESRGDPTSLVERSKAQAMAARSSSADFDEFALRYSSLMGFDKPYTFTARVAAVQATSTPTFACDIRADGTGLEQELLNASDIHWKQLDYPDRERGFAVFTNMREWIQVARTGLALHDQMQSTPEATSPPEVLITIGALHRDLGRKFACQGAQVKENILFESRQCQVLPSIFNGALLRPAGHLAISLMHGRVPFQ